MWPSHSLDYFFSLVMRKSIAMMNWLWLVAELLWSILYCRPCRTRSRRNIGSSYTERKTNTWHDVEEWTFSYSHFLLCSLEVLENTGERPAKENGGVTFFCADILKNICFQNSAPLSIAILTCCLTERTTIVVREDDLMQWRTTFCVRCLNSAKLCVISPNFSSAPSVQKRWRESVYKSRN